MHLHLSGLLFYLVISLPAGNCMVGHRGIEFRPCTAINGLCFFGCRPGWTWMAFCNNIMSCCKEEKLFAPPQTKVV
ncbi:defensin beta 136 [Peromyscus eremicus]|uniref:defensin beta 136 n=1 Tax=Peromyscus eremicus TaxID=42410 RepID=UPI0027DC454E|nr:defensin beta 136 [Peromyscus eremicus]